MCARGGVQSLIAAAPTAAVGLPHRRRLWRAGGDGVAASAVAPHLTVSGGVLPCLQGPPVRVAMSHEIAEIMYGSNATCPRLGPLQDELKTARAGALSRRCTSWLAMRMHARLPAALNTASLRFTRARDATHSSHPSIPAA